MKNRILGIGLVLAFSLLFASRAFAAPVLTDGLGVVYKTDVNRFYAGGWPRWAQSFTANVGGTLDSAVFYLDHWPTLGSHAGYVDAELWAITGTYGVDSVPTGAPIAHSLPVDGSAIPDNVLGPVTFRFDNSVLLAKGARYAIVVHWAIQDTGATCEVARSDVDASKHAGNMSGWSTAYGNRWVTGIPAAGDLIFSVYVNPSKTATQLTFSAPSVCGYKSARVSGYLKDINGKALVDKPVKIQYLSSGIWKTATTLYTDKAGYYGGTMAPTTKITYRASFAGDASYSAKSTSGKTVLPKVRLTRSGSWDTKYDGKTYYYKGYIEPKHAASDANKVKFKMYKKGSDGVYHWRKTVSASYSYYSSTKTRWTAKVVFPSEGKWRVRAHHAADARNASSYSTYDYVAVE